MKKCVRKKSLIILFFLGISIYGQDINNRWAIGLGAGGSLYSEKDLNSIGFRYSEQFPRISIARYMFKNVTFAGAFSNSIDDNKKYISFDGEVRYDFGTSENMITIYVLAGGSLIDTKHLLPLINFGFGGTLWLSEKFGLQGQILYKINSSNFNSQASHVFAGGGIVFRFKMGDSYGIQPKGKSRRRLWEMKH